MGEVIPLFEKDAAYKGVCLKCENVWIVTKEQLDVALGCGILYSPCCESPATIHKQPRAKVKRNDKANL